MAEFELSQSAQQWVIVVLIWVGFGTLVGLLARVLIPAREPGGAVGTILLGIAGSALGPLALCKLLHFEQFNPISPLGLLAAVAAAFVLLIGYRLLAACFFVQQDEE